jgi:predicted amidohydrolase YtcJ
MLVFSAADFEDFLFKRPDMPSNMEGELKKVVRFLVENRWPFRMHATYNETIGRALDVFEEIARDLPFNDLLWFFDHAETVTEANLERIKRLGGGIAVQHRMAFQGEYFIDRYGKKAAAESPPIRKMLEMQIPVGAGTDATRVASYNPWISLYWLVSGKTVGGTRLYGPKNRLERLEALRLYTQGSAKLSREENKKGTLSIGMYADLALLTHDYITCKESAIKDISSRLTMVGGRIVYAKGEYASLDEVGELPVSPSWSPVAHFGGYYQPQTAKCPLDCLLKSPKEREKPLNPWSFGCDCFT